MKQQSYKSMLSLMNAFNHQGIKCSEERLNEPLVLNRFNLVNKI